MSAIRTAKPMTAVMSEMLSAAKFAAMMASDDDAAAAPSNKRITTGPTVIVGMAMISAILILARRAARNVPPGESQYSARAVV